MKKLIVLLLGLLLIVGCGGSFKRQAEYEAEGRGKTSKKEYKPLNSPDDKEIIPEKYPLALTSTVDSTYITDNTRTVPHYPMPDSTFDGSQIFRIQLFSSNTYGPAANEINIAKEVFDRQVYLDFEVPYYKVRVGNFYNRNDAESYLTAAEEAGYKNAWVVKVSLDIKKLEDLYEDVEIMPLIDPALQTSDTILTDPIPNENNDEYPEN